MAVEVILPSADDSGWEAGDFDDINNTIAAPSGVPLETSIDDDVVVIDLANVVTIVDADTVNTITVKIRAKDTGAGGKNQIAFDVDVGGGGLGESKSASLNNSYTNFDITNNSWDLDHTVAQLNAMQLIARADQTGMGTAADWQIDELEVHIDYTPAAAALIEPPLVHSQAVPRAANY